MCHLQRPEDDIVREEEKVGPRLCVLSIREASLGEKQVCKRVWSAVTEDTVVSEEVVVEVQRDREQHEEE